MSDTFLVFQPVQFRGSGNCSGAISKSLRLSIAWRLGENHNMKIERAFVGAAKPKATISPAGRDVGFAGIGLTQQRKIAVVKDVCPPATPRNIIPLVAARGELAMELRRELAQGQVWETAAYIALGACFLALVVFAALT